MIEVRDVEREGDKKGEQGVEQSNGKG